MQLYLLPSKVVPELRKNTLGKNKFFGYQKERIIICQQASWPEDDVKPIRPLYTFIWSTWFWQGSGLLTPCDSVFIPMYNKKYISKPENKENRSISGKTDSPMSFLSCSPFFWLNSYLERGYSPSLLILPGLLRSDQGGLRLLSFGRTERRLWPM